MEDDALDLLTRIAMEASMRYAIQMITTSSLVASKRKAGSVEIADIKRVYGLFVDLKRSSTQFLMEYQKDFMFNELADESSEDESDGDRRFFGLRAPPRNLAYLSWFAAVASGGRTRPGAGAVLRVGRGRVLATARRADGT